MSVTYQSVSKSLSGTCVVCLRFIPALSFCFHPLEISLFFTLNIQRSYLVKWWEAVTRIYSIMINPKPRGYTLFTVMPTAATTEWLPAASVQWLTEIKLPSSIKKLQKICFTCDLQFTFWFCRSYAATHSCLWMVSAPTTCIKASWETAGL